MRRGRRPARARTVAWVAGTGALIALVLAVGGCAPPEDSTSTNGSPGADATGTLRTVTLPDLSTLAEPVQDQIRERYAAVAGSMPGTTPRPRSAATRMASWVWS